MVKPKSQSKKPQKHGVDFKKIKRKLGRKLPPPKNATNTEIKSKAIVLPEQSIASDKTGLAVSKKGLTLKELLQQSSHHNYKVRKDALLGIKDLLLKHPAELKLHKHAVIEKLRERVGDDDKFVRETSYQLFKSVIFPGCKEENREPTVSLLVAYIFNAMTHLTLEVRLMAFKFFDLAVEYHPSSFSLHSEKVLQNYDDILRKNQYLEDKGKLKCILTGLARVLALLCNGREDGSVIKNKIPVHGILHAYEPDVGQGFTGLPGIIKKLMDLLPILVSSFLDFMPLMHKTSQLDVQSYDCLQFILQNINLIIKFIICEIHVKEPARRSFSPFQNRDSAVYDVQDILPRTLKKLWDVFPLNLADLPLPGKNEHRIFVLNCMVTQIYFQLSEWNCFPADFLEKFVEFIQSSLSTEIQSSKVFHDKHLLALIDYIPRLTMQISGYWRSRVLQAFTGVFKNCNADSSMKLTCLSAIGEIFTLERSWLYQDGYDPIFLDYQIAWLRDLPSQLISFHDKNPLCSKAVLRLQLQLGQAAPVNSLISEEIDNMLPSLRGFYSWKVDEVIFYGPFVRLSTDIQELAVCCLFYFSFIDSLFLSSLVSCCLYDDLDPCILSRILEVLHSAFKAGHIQIEDYASFHITLLSRFQVYPENIYQTMNSDGKSNRKTFSSLTGIVCSYLSQIGDNHLVFQMLEKIIVDKICGMLALDNKCAFLRLLTCLDTKPTRLGGQSIINISHFLLQYLIDISRNFEEDDSEPTNVINVKRERYYILPTFFLFHRNGRLLNLVLNVMVSEVSSLSGSSHFQPPTTFSTRICGIVSVLFHMYKDVKIRKVLLSCKSQIEALIQSLLSLLSSEKAHLTLEEWHKLKSATNQLNAIAISDRPSDVQLGAGSK